MTVVAAQVLPQPRPAEPGRQYRVLAVMHRKGGVGKTKSAIYVGQELANRGRNVGLVDADQGTAGIYKWLIDLQRDFPGYDLPWHFYQHQPRYGMLVNAIAEQAGLTGAGVFVIDNPAEYPEQLQAAAAAADVILVPCGTHQDEIRNLPDVYRDALAGARRGTPIRVLLTRVEREGGGAAAEARADLVERGYEVLTTEIPRNAGVYGRFGKPIEDTGRYAGVVDELEALEVGL